jgi:hypothetical protein
MFDCHTILLTIASALIILVVSSAWLLHKKLNAEGQNRVTAYWLTNTGLMSKLCRVYMNIRGWKLLY